MIGIIGGSGVYELTEIADSKEEKLVKTEYGEVLVTILDIKDKKVLFIPRHASGHSIPPHKINFKANIQALKDCGVNQIIATNAVGSLNLDLAPGDFVLADDFLDFTVKRDRTFYDDVVIHVDVSDPFCSRLREVIASCGNVKNSGATLVCTEGPRFETRAEIRMFTKLDCDLVGMTSLPEVVLAKEKEMCYASICVVSNYAAGISPDKLTLDEVSEIMAVKKKELINVILQAIEKLDEDFDCPCLHALEGSGA